VCEARSMIAVVRQHAAVVVEAGGYGVAGLNYVEVDEVRCQEAENIVSFRCSTRSLNGTGGCP
jgi:hypothetical protein